MRTLLTTILILVGSFVLEWKFVEGPRLRLGSSVSPPFGWKKLCREYPSECALPDVLSPTEILFTHDVFTTLTRVNNEVNEAIEPMTDMDHWGVAERWNFAEDGYGDCEDYVLLKQRMLIAAGLPRGALLITIVKDEKEKESHAVLTVRTDQGDMILDNMRNGLLSPKTAGYRLLKSQSPTNINEWLSVDLATAPSPVPVNPPKAKNMRAEHVAQDAPIPKTSPPITLTEAQQRIAEFQRLLKDKRAALGPTVFEYHFMNGAWGYVNQGCLIGGTGDLYTYDELETPGVRLARQVDGREYARALDLAKSLGGQKLERRQVAFDAGTGVWIASIGDTNAALKEVGVEEGELSDPNAVELVKLISGWCPSAATALEFERILHRPLDDTCTQPDSGIPIQICTPH
jgi:predicted transglutaminase-like cysteine proteinase